MSKLKEGALVCIGEGTDGRPVIILQHEWSSLRFIEGKLGIIALGFGSATTGYAYRNPKFSQIDILTHWPSATTKQKASKTQNNRIDEKSLTQWFRRRVRGWPKNEAPPNQQKDLADAKKAFPGRKIPQKFFRSMRTDAVPNWRRQGKRRPEE